MALSINNAYMGRVYFLASATTRPTWLTYASKQWKGALTGITFPTDLTEIATMQGNFEFKDAESGSIVDRFANKVTVKGKTTGKITISVDSATYNALIADREGIMCSLVVLSEDIDQGEFVHNIVPHFSRTSKFGDQQIADLTFEFDQATNIAPTDARYINFAITAPVV